MAQLPEDIIDRINAMERRIKQLSTAVGIRLTTTQAVAGAAIQVTTTPQVHGGPTETTTA
jgi:hypothetical protein